ncbi:MAG TPA: sugar ABC transporter ATP-binding protein [Planctomycetota bacterium]
MSVPLVRIEHITKSFGGVHALTDVSFCIEPGEVHALCGENGAGKSTLIKTLAGSCIPDHGQISFADAPLRLGSVRASEAAGVAVIHQESTAFPHLNAEDNIFVGREPRWMGGLLLDRRRMREGTRKVLAGLGEQIDQNVPVGELPVAQRQMIGIARALQSRCRLLILDEPTASLSARETTVLFRVIRQLRSEGVSLLYVSHRMEEIFDLANRVTVLRDGRFVDTLPIADVTRDGLIRLMVGRDLSTVPAPGEHAAAAGQRTVLEVRKLCRANVFEDISFSVQAGEVVGLAGLVGAGRSEVARAVFGVDRYDSGSVVVNGRPLPRGSVRAVVRHGVALVPEDRQHLGLVLPMSVGDNLTMAVLDSLTRFGLRSHIRELTLAEKLMKDLSVRAASAAVPAETLSGGNQQKLVLGKWLAAAPKVLILDEPTRGVDVGAKAEVHKLIRQFATEGMATLLISSELPELLAVSDRILVMRAGRIAGQFSRTEATQEKILELALGRASAETVEATA